MVLSARGPTLGVPPGRTMLGYSPTGALFFFPLDDLGLVDLTAVGGTDGDKLSDGGRFDDDILLLILIILILILILIHYEKTN